MTSNTTDTPIRRWSRPSCLAAAIALFASLFALAALSGQVIQPGVARADVIDEYTEPPPPTPEPPPDPTTSGGGKPSDSGGGSGSQGGSGLSYSYDSSSAATTAAAAGTSKPKESEKGVAPRASEAAAVALEPPSGDSSFLSAAFGGVGWVLPSMMILIVIGAFTWTRLDRSKVRSSRVSRPEH